MVALGGALGSVGRYGIGLALVRFSAFPVGTLVIGFCAGLFDAEQRSRSTGLFLMVGFCGGFTTCSAFSRQTCELLEQQAWLKAGGNVVLSVALCLLGTWLGFLLGQSLRKTA